MDPNRLPVIVGVGQVTDTTTPPETALSPCGLMLAAAHAAAADSGAGAALLRALDSVVVIRLFSDTSPAMRSPFGTMSNPPWSVARRLGATPRELLYPPQGGDTPQTMLARACGRIAAGESEEALIVGAEALRTELAARRAGLALDWSEPAPRPPEELGGAVRLFTAAEEAHGARSAIAMYALFEQAIRAARGQSPAERRAALGRLFAGFAAVARDNPLATRRGGFSAGEITAVTPANPTVGFPYTKLMTANMYVDQAAALLVCSQARADALGVPAGQRVYLHASAQAHDQWFVSERAELHRSAAIRGVVRETLAAAGAGLADVAAFDIYSCFPSAVQVACDEIGLAAEDPRGLTVTGGLPFFGGPGNNYVTHAIAEMVRRLRRLPGRFGLVTANGGLLTKHAAGLYAATPPRAGWVEADSARVQRAVDAQPLVPQAEAPQGAALVESYTVVNGRQGPERGIVLGRLVASGERFIANTPADAATLARLEAEDLLAAPGQVRQQAGRNLFTPA